MLRRQRLILLLCASLGARAAVWQAPAGGHVPRSVRPYAVEGGRALWDEFGLVEAEQADFGAWQAVAYRMHDATGAYAAARWMATSHADLQIIDNIVVVSSSRIPGPAALAAFLAPASRSGGALPMLPADLPPGFAPGSVRYILGPASLAEFAPGVPAAALAFQFSTEAVVAQYPAGRAGRLTLMIASFPTPGMARGQAVEFRKIPGALVKRSGPLVALIPSPPEAESAQRLLSGVHYMASITWDEKPPDPHMGGNVKRMILAIAQLILFLLVLCVVGGLAVAGARLLRQRFGNTNADESVIVLHLADK